VTELLFGYINDDVAPDNMPDIIDISDGKGWESFMSYYEAMADGESAAVVTYAQGESDGRYYLTYLARVKDGFFHESVAVTDKSITDERHGMYPYVVYTEDNEYRTFWLTDNEIDTLDELKKYDGSMLLFKIENAALRSVDASIDITTVPTGTDDFEQVKVFLAAYTEDAAFPENYPAIWNQRNGENAEKLLAFYDNVSAGYDDAIIILTGYSGTNELLVCYLAHVNGHFFWAADYKRIESVSDAGKIYTYRVYDYLLRSEYSAGDKVKQMYFLSNDAEATYNDVMNAKLSSAKDEFKKFKILYSMEAE
jgi:hypothetical protein